MSRSAAVPPLPHGCGSWIIGNLQTGRAVEIFDRRNAEKLAAIMKPGVEVFTAVHWLHIVNSQLKEECP